MSKAYAANKKKEEVKAQAQAQPQVEPVKQTNNNAGNSAPKATQNTTTSSVKVVKPGLRKVDDLTGRASRVQEHKDTISKPVSKTTASQKKETKTESYDEIPVLSNDNPFLSLNGFEGKDFQAKAANPLLGIANNMTGTTKITNPRVKDATNGVFGDNFTQQKKDPVADYQKMLEKENSTTHKLYGISGTTPVLEARTAPATDEEIVKEYESIPNYGLLQRITDSTKSDAYARKQGLLNEYEQAKARVAQKNLRNAGITDEEVQHFLNWQWLGGDTQGYDENGLPYDKEDPVYKKVQNAINQMGIHEMDLVNAYGQEHVDATRPTLEGWSTKEQPFLSSLTAIPLNTAESLINTGYNTVAYTLGLPMSGLPSMAQDIRNEVSEDWNPVAKQAYNLGNTVGDMLFARGIGGGSVPELALGTMGVEKASGVINNAMERGLDPAQIMAEGITSGVTTAITEAIPMGILDDIAETGLASEGGKILAKEVAKRVGAAMASEGLQEMSEDVADAIADRIIAGNQSEINLKILELESHGVSHEEAQRQVWEQWLGEVAMDGVMGALSGGILAGGEVAFQGMTGNTYNVPSLEEITDEGVNNSQPVPEITPTDVNNLAPLNENVPAETPELNEALQNIVNQLNAEQATYNAVKDNSTNFNDQNGKVYAAPKNINAGRATNIQNEYTGNKPSSVNAAERVEINPKSYDRAVSELSYKGDTKLSSHLREIYENIFKSKGGQHSILMDNVEFNGGDYAVELNKKSVSKVVNDGFYSPEKFAVLEDIDNVVKNGEYVGSGKSNKSNKDIIRYDYFETPVSINGKDFIVTFDVEVYKGSNNYRTHKVINEINLAETTDANASNGITATPLLKSDAPIQPDLLQIDNNNLSNESIPHVDENVNPTVNPEQITPDNVNITQLNETDSQYRDDILNAIDEAKLQGEDTSELEYLLNKLESKYTDESMNYEDIDNSTIPNVEENVAEEEPDYEPIAENDRYVSEDVDYTKLRDWENIEDVRERGYSDTVKRKTDAPDELKAEFVDNPSLYIQLHNDNVQAEADRIYDNTNLDGALTKCNSLIQTKNPVAVPLAHRVSKELVKQGRMEDAVTLTRSLAQALTEAGQFTQAVTMNMLNESPIAALTYMERMIESLNAEGLLRFGKKWTDFYLTEEERAMFENIKEGDTDAINEAYGKIWARINMEYPVTGYEKLLELRRIGLLCNMRTTVRNLSSNTAMLPMRWNAGRITALAESIYQSANSKYVRSEHKFGQKVSAESKALANEICDAMYEQLFDPTVTNKWKENLNNVQVFKGTKVDAWIDKVCTKGAKMVLNSNIKTLECIDKNTGGAITKMAKACGLESIQDVADLVGIDKGFMNVANNALAHHDIKPSVLETVRNFTYFMLGEFGDTPFVKANFKQKLASYIEANGISKIEDMPQDAIALAVQEANKATFHDDSRIAQGMEDIRRAINKMTGKARLGDWLITFAKTPGNIASRMIEYSPIGLIKSINDSITSNKTIKTVEQRIKDFEDELASSKLTLREARDIKRTLNDLEADRKQAYYDMTSALTLLGQGAEGSLLMLLGAILHRMGLVIGNLSQDASIRKYQTTVLNMQQNAIQVGNTSYSIDAFQPSLSPMVFGAILDECFMEQDLNFAQSCKQAGISVFDSWLKSSPMGNVSDLFEGYGSSAENIMDTMLELPTSMVPSQVGAIARIEDRTMRNTKDATSTFKTIENEMIAKIPGLSETLPASYDLWGRERIRQEDKDSAIFAQLMNPGTTKYSNKTEIDDDIISLYERTGNSNAFPHAAKSSYTLNNESYKLDNKQVSEYQRIMGSLSYDMAKQYIQSDAWKNATDDDRVDELDSIYKFAESIAKRDVLGVAPQNSEKLIGVYDEKGIDGVLTYNRVKNSRESTSNANTMNAINQLDLSDEEKGYYASQFINPSANAQEMIDKYGDAGMYYWYSIADADNKKTVMYENIENSGFSDEVKEDLTSIVYNSGKQKKSNDVPALDMSSDVENTTSNAMPTLSENPTVDEIMAARNAKIQANGQYKTMDEIPALKDYYGTEASNTGNSNVTLDDSIVDTQGAIDKYGFDKAQVVSKNGWVDKKVAIPYLTDDLGLDATQRGEVLYHSGQRGKNEKEAYETMGGYDGVATYYDINYYGDNVYGNSNGSLARQEIIDYLKSEGYSVDDINAWLRLLDFNKAYNG